MLINSGKLFTLETGKRKSRSEKFKLNTERYRTTSGEIFTIKIISLRIINKSTPVSYTNIFVLDSVILCKGNLLRYEVGFS